MHSTSKTNVDICLNSIKEEEEEENHNLTIELILSVNDCRSQIYLVCTGLFSVSIYLDNISNMQPINQVRPRMKTEKPFLFCLELSKTDLVIGADL